MKVLSEEYGLHLWPSALALSEYLLFKPELSQGKQIIEVSFFDCSLVLALAYQA